MLSAVRAQQLELGDPPSKEARLVSTASPPYTVVQINPAFTTLTGFVEGDVKDKALGWLCVDKDRTPQTVQDALGQLVSDVRSGLPRHVMMQHEHKSGNPLFTFTQVFPFVEKPALLRSNDERAPMESSSSADESAQGTNPAKVEEKQSNNAADTSPIAADAASVAINASNAADLAESTDVCTHFLWVTTNINEAAPHPLLALIRSVASQVCGAHQCHRLAGTSER